MKNKTLLALVAATLSVSFYTGVASAADAPAAGSEKTAATAKTITGKSACATCEGVTPDGHAILLIDKDGYRWVLIGDSEGYKAAHKVRQNGKTITATLAGEPVVKKDSDGKEFKEVKVSDVKIDA